METMGVNVVRRFLEGNDSINERNCGVAFRNCNIVYSKKAALDENVDELF